MKKKVLLACLKLLLLYATVLAAPLQSEKPVSKQAKKPQSCCDSFTAFRKKQKANEEKQQAQSMKEKK